MGHILYNLPRFMAAVWHTQRMANFVKIFRWRFIAPVWHSLKGAFRQHKHLSSDILTARPNYGLTFSVRHGKNAFVQETLYLQDINKPTSFS